MAGRVTSYAGISGKTNFGSHMVAELRQAVGTGWGLVVVKKEFGSFKRGNTTHKQYLIAVGSGETEFWFGCIKNTLLSLTSNVFALT